MLAKLTWWVPLLVFCLIVIIGCSEGPLWKSGYLSPRIRRQWQDEEQIATTLFGKRREMREWVDSARDAGLAAQEEVAEKLSAMVAEDPVLLLRIEAVHLLAELPGEKAAAGIRLAAGDHEVAVRRAAVNAAPGTLADEQSAQLLASISRGDEDEDLRISAIAALKSTSGPVTLAALGEALQHPNPAMQLTAAESLAVVSGRNLGNDIQAWQEYVRTAQAAVPQPSLGKSDSSIRR